MGQAQSNTFLAALIKQVENVEDISWSALTNSHVVPAFRKQHFSHKELQFRLLCFGGGAGVCLSILGLVALLTIARRKYGSLQQAYAAGLTSWKELIDWRRRDYRLLPTDWLGVAADAKSSEDDNEDDWPMFRGGKMNAEDLAKDAAKLEAKRLAKLREENGGVLPDLETDEEGPDAGSKRGKGGGGVGKVFKPAESDAPLMSAESKIELFRIQAEQFKELHKTEDGGCASWILCAKMPISVLLYLVYSCTCTGIPLLAARSASCDQGFPWGDHIPFLGVFLLVKSWELFLFQYDTSVIGDLGIFEFFIKFGSSFLGFLDGYSDAVSIVIAHQCGSDLWYWMAFFYFFGVVFMQWFVMAILCLYFDTSHTCFYKMMHMDALALCCTMDPNDKHALLVWKLVNIFRTLFEDLPQCVLQLLFIHYVKQNYFMVVSVVIGVGTSFLAVLAALKRAGEAAGTNWERLQTLSTMKKALVDKDIAFFGAAATAKEQDLLDAKELHTQFTKADTAFDLPCCRKYVKVMPNSEDAPEEAQQLLERSATAAREQTDHTAYSGNCRTMAFATDAAKARELARTEAETADSSAFKRSMHDEGRHTKREYDSRRRTVEWAIQQQEEREKRIMAMLTDAP